MNKNNKSIDDLLELMYKSMKNSNHLDCENYSYQIIRRSNEINDEFKKEVLELVEGVYKHSKNINNFERKKALLIDEIVNFKG